MKEPIENFEMILMVIEPSNTLKKFHQRFCPDIPIDSPKIIFKLLEKIGENKGENNEKNNNNKYGDI